MTVERSTRPDKGPRVDTRLFGPKDFEADSEGGAKAATIAFMAQDKKLVTELANPDGLFFYMSTNPTTFVARSLGG